jgi:hypothetical protein
VTHWLVLPSPFLGSAAYAPLADALAVGTDRASVASASEPLTAAGLMDSWTATAASLGDVVLVPHSNAGHFAPGVSERRGGLPVVFMDAALPASSGRSPLVPPGLMSVLAELAVDGQLPRWTRWWPRGDVEAVLPGDWFERIDAAVPQVPLAYAEDSVAVPERWERGRCAYLAFGADTYADELARADEAGWPVRILDGARHLHCVVDPDETAGAVRSVRALVG